MPIIDFPFLRLSPNAITRPTLIVKIQNPNTGMVLDTAGIIDTGADACAVPAAYADTLGYNLTSGIQKKVGTGNGETLAYSHICKIEVYHTKLLRQGKTETIYTTSEILIDFMPNLPIVLLGVSNFLGQFFLGIDYKAQLFSLRA